MIIDRYLLFPFFFIGSSKISNESFSCRDVHVTEALRTQIEIQKLLHEQLKVP
jgi:uncharacterized protein YijF (DUF1287 family)